MIGPAPATVGDLTSLRSAAGWGWVDVRQGRPTAAFSRRDTLAPGYPVAVRVARAHGFEPVVRPVGGSLAAYHGGAVVLDVLARHPEPAQEVGRRFIDLSGAVVSALRMLDVDARVGPVPGEYCPGKFSVNARGSTKLAGIAQRLTRGSLWLSAVVIVADPEPVRSVLSATYPHLGQKLDPATVGCVSAERPGVTPAQVQQALVAALKGVLPLGDPLESAGPDAAVRLALVDCWRSSPNDVPLTVS